MRKLTTILMMCFMVISFITGIAESSASHTGPARAHLAFTIMFVIVILFHIGMNHKAIRRYFRGAIKNTEAERAAK